MSWPRLLDRDVLVSSFRAILLRTSSGLIVFEQNTTAQLARFAVFCQHAIVFAVRDAIFDRAAELWVTGRQGGHPHNDADLIIAATALEHGRTLAGYPALQYLQPGRVRKS